MSSATIIGQNRTSDYYQVTVNTSEQYFDAIWNVIKTWDINVRDAYQGYCGANGNHVQLILDAIKKQKSLNAFDAAMKTVGP